MKDRSSVRYHYGRLRLVTALRHCGVEYFEYAAIIDEHNLTILRDAVTSSYTCDLCPKTINRWMRGTRFSCLDCLDTDLCADCYFTWQKSDGKMELCKGHTFCEIPRPCWYTLKPGTVTEDGKSLAEVIEFLIDRFTRLLDEVAKQATAIVSNTEATTSSARPERSTFDSPANICIRSGKSVQLMHLTDTIKSTTA